MVIDCTEEEKNLLARIMRAEALSEGDLGMLMVGNVIINRCVANCYTFKGVRTLTDAIYQKNQFSGTKSSLFQGKPTKREKDLAERVLKGEKFHPADRALWFYAEKNSECKNTWYNQPNSGKYKNHCFYKPDKGKCEEIY